MHILYKVTYLPHLNTDLPKYYVGSKYNYKGNYYGSVASSMIFEYTNGLPLKQWWKNSLKDVSNFTFEIIEVFDDVTPQELVEKEFELHQQLNVLSEEYFNQSLATKGWVSSKKSEETRKRMAEKTREYWESEEGQKKRERLQERNRQTKSQEMKDKWANPEYREHASDALKSIQKTKEHKSKIGIANSKDIPYKGKIYRGWKELESETGVTTFLYKKYYLNGYEPEININSKKPQYILLETV